MTYFYGLIIFIKTKKVLLEITEAIIHETALTRSLQHTKH